MTSYRNNSKDMNSFHDSEINDQASTFYIKDYWPFTELKKDSLGKTRKGNTENVV